MWRKLADIIMSMRGAPELKFQPQFHIDTKISRQELSEQLRKHEPWRIGIYLSNGLKTRDFETMEPFSDTPLQKLRMIMQHGGEEWFYGRRVLDVGSNIGYNSITLAKLYHCQVTGLEVNEANVKKSELIAGWCEADLSFIKGDAVTYSNVEAYDLILHLGTLYASPGPGARAKKRRHES